MKQRGCPTPLSLLDLFVLCGWEPPFSFRSRNLVNQAPTHHFKVSSLQNNAKLVGKSSRISNACKRPTLTHQPLHSLVLPHLPQLSPIHHFTSKHSSSTVSSALGTGLLFFFSSSPQPSTFCGFGFSYCSCAANQWQ